MLKNQWNRTVWSRWRWHWIRYSLWPAGECDRWAPAPDSRFVNARTSSCTAARALSGGGAGFACCPSTNTKLGVISALPDVEPASPMNPCKYSHALPPSTSLQWTFGPQKLVQVGFQADCVTCALGSTQSALFSSAGRVPTWVKHYLIGIARAVVWILC